MMTNSDQRGRFYCEPFVKSVSIKIGLGPIAAQFAIELVRSLFKSGHPIALRKLLKPATKSTEI